MSIRRSIAAFRKDSKNEYHRYHSWDHCYRYFRKARLIGLAADREHAALQLAFYLASWGMYRGSSFLLQHTYKVHCGVIDVIAGAQFADLWDPEFGASETDRQFMPRLGALIGELRLAYQPFAPTSGSAQPTDTLITKIILGTFGCLPACDRYFIDGFKREGFKYSSLNDHFVDRVLGFCHKHRRELEREQTRIEEVVGIRYPLMKLVDMYFWQIGYERAAGANQ
jgi:hypothetical protein